MNERTKPADAGSVHPIPLSHWAAVLVLAALLFFIFVSRSRHINAPHPEAASPCVVLETAGQVRRPGVYVMEPPVTVGEAIGHAGGTLDGDAIDIDGDVLKRVVSNGERVRVEILASGAILVHIEPMSAAARLALGQQLDINQATAEELLLVPQFKPEWAAAVVERRAAHPWQSLNELQEIQGVGAKTVHKWKPYLKAQLDPGPPLESAR
jgi:DNA uptake protein ComE-like DNA-binding protein